VDSVDIVDDVDHKVFLFPSSEGPGVG